MRRVALATALIAFAGSPVLACEWKQSVFTPVPAEEEVVMTPAPVTPPDETGAEED